MALLALVATFFALPTAMAAADEGDVVANPGDFEITVVGGALVIKDDGENDPAIDVDLTPSELPQCSDGINNDDGEGDPETWLAPFDELIDYPDDPECSSPEDNSEIGAGFQEKIDTTFSGTVDWDGNITVEQEDIVFPKSYLPGPFGLVVEATIGAAGPATGTLDPATGAVSLDASLQVEVAIPAASNNCLLGPLNVQLTTGETDPPAPNEAISGVPYANDGTLTLVNNSFGVPALTFSPTCALFSVINDALGLPSPAGMNTAIFAGQMDTVFEAPAPPNTAPVADAGEDQTVEVGSEVTLDGSGSSDADEDDLTFSWTQTGGDATVELDDATSATPSFTAPAEADELEFSLVVNDGTEDSAPDTVVVTVEPAPNTAPVADAGEDQTVEVGSEVTLDGSGSSDADEDDLTFSWTQTGGDATVELDDATSATPSFTAPAEADELEFSLVVNDGTEDSAPDTVVVTVEEGPPTITNPGYFQLELVDGNLQIKETAFPLSPAELPQCSDGVDNDEDGAIDFPADAQCANANDHSELVTGNQPKQDIVIAGNMAADGTFTIPSAVLSAPPVAPAAGVYFPTQYLALDSYLATINIRPAPVAGSGSAPFTGTLDPATGQLNVTIALRINIVVSGIPIFGSSTCNLGDGNHRIVVDLTTGTTSPPAPNEPITGSPYRWNTGMVTLVNNSFNVPGMGQPNPPIGTHPNCSGLLGSTISGSLNDALGLPSPAGNNTTAMTFRSAPIFNEAPNATPVVDAGDDITGVLTGDNVNLGASATDADDDPLSYKWTQTGGPTVTLSGANTANPSFTARKVGTDKVLTFQASVTDGRDTGTDTVTVTVDNQAPTAVAGEDQESTRQATVNLSAAGTSDPDNEPLSYSWAQTDGEDPVSLTGAETTTPSFTVPADVALGTVYEFTLTVDDSDGGVDTDTVTVTIVNAAPVANAGADQKADTGETVTLDATGSSDVDDDELSYSWTQTGGPAVELVDETSATPSFSAPARGTTVTFEVTVSDGQLTGTDSVSVKVPLIVNPGPVRFAISSGEIRFENALRSNTWDLSGGVISGTINEDGVISVPAGTLSSPPGEDQQGIYLPTGSLTVGANNATIIFTTPNASSGSVNPETGAVSLTIGVRPQLTGYGAANNCFLGGGSAISVAMTGSGYSTETGISTVSNTTFAVPNLTTSSSNCGTTTTRNAVGQAIAGNNNGGVAAGQNQMVLTTAVTPILNQTTPAGPGAIAGVVTAGGDPVAGARVRYYTADSSALLGQVFTDGDGAYSLADLEPGDYKVRVNATGYVTQFWSGKPSFATANAVTVTNEATATADFSLAAVPTVGTLSGVVTGNGDGVAGSLVRLYNTSAQIVTTTVTDSEGGYAFDVVGGTYKVLVLDSSGDWVSPRWVGGTSFSSASGFSVTGGGTTSGADVALVSTAVLGSISGVIDEGGSPAEGLRVVLYNPDAQILGTAFSGADGSYSFGELEEGTYFVRVREQATHADAWWDGANRWRTATPIVVGSGADVSGIDITVTLLP